jgi:hypothetical protein
METSLTSCLIGRDTSKKVHRGMGDLQPDTQPKGLFAFMHNSHIREEVIGWLTHVQASLSSDTA